MEFLIALPLIQQFLLDELTRRGGKATAGEMVNATEDFFLKKRLIPQSEIEKELGKLVERKLVKIEIDGRFRFYHLTNIGK